jgi:hypothetical protein
MSLPHQQHDDQPETLRRALGLAAQILEELPDHLRPRSNIEDMRRILDRVSTGRDSYIIAQAIATALAFRALNANSLPFDFESDSERAIARLDGRMQDFRTLFEAAKHCNAGLLAFHFAQALANLRSHAEDEAD